MRAKVTAERLAEILRLHEMWLAGKEGGVRADLRNVDLSEADLHGAVLRGAKLTNAKLRNADLSGVDLRNVVLSGACLTNANLSYADLTNADLTNADLRNVDLSKAVLTNAVLRGADLTNAVLTNAVLSGAVLRYADLRGAIGVHVLTHTQHGYAVLAIWQGDQWRIQAGCHDFPVEEARRHWGSEAYPYKPDAERILLMLDWLERQPTPGES